jgi:ERCC4-type nuclease
MLQVDYREGSGDYGPLLEKAGLPAEVVEAPGLDFGDFAWVGRGQKGTQVMVGVELKKLPDLLQSMRDGRLPNHQVPGMLDKELGIYDYGYLIVEGVWRRSQLTGMLEVPKGLHKIEWVEAHGGWTVNELQKRLHTLTRAYGLEIHYTAGPTETVALLDVLFRWWTDVDMDEHKSHLVEHKTFSWAKMTDFREVLRRFPHLGLKGSLGAERAFKSLKAAANAPVEHWANIEVPVGSSGKTKRLGIKVAEDIVRFIRGE